MFCLIHLRILHNAIPESALSWEFCYMYLMYRSDAELHLNYIFIFIDMFVHHIPVYALICLRMLYNINVGCTSSWVFFPVSLLCMGYYSTLLLLYSQFHSYVFECYIYVYCNMFVYFIQYNPCWCFTSIILT